MAASEKVFMNKFIIYFVVFLFSANTSVSFGFWNSVQSDAEALAEMEVVKDHAKDAEEAYKELHKSPFTREEDDIAWRKVQKARAAYKEAFEKYKKKVPNGTVYQGTEDTSKDHLIEVALQEKRNSNEPLAIAKTYPMNNGDSSTASKDRKPDSALASSKWTAVTLADETLSDEDFQELKNTKLGKALERMMAEKVEQMQKSYHTDPKSSVCEIVKTCDSNTTSTSSSSTTSSTTHNH